MIDTLVTQVRKIERAATAPSPPVGAFFRLGVIQAFYHETWTADVQVMDHYYEGVQISHNIREDLLTVGRKVQIALVVLGDATDALVMCTYGGRPPEDPRMDGVLGHGHRIGVPGDGRPIRSEDVT